MPFNDLAAATADVVYRTNLGVFKAEQAEAQAVYARTTGAMSDEALKLAVAQERLNRAIARQGPESYAAGRASVAYRAQVDELAASETAAAAAAERASRQRIAAYAGAARTVGSTLTRYVTLPTALATAAAVKLGFDFEQSMELIHTQAGATVQELNLTSAGVLRLVKSGQSFGQTANDMAKGLFFIESEGVRGGKALDILRVAAAGAAVGQTSLANTSNALTSAMRVYKLEAGDAGQTMATLLAIVGTGKMHVEDLTAALGTKFLPVAAQLGITLPQAGAALDIFTQAGVPAESAATNLTTAFLKMLNPTAASQKSLALMGITSTELADELQKGGLPAALQLLSKRYDQLRNSQGKVVANQAIVSAFGGVKGGASVLTLVQQYDGYLSDLGRIQKQNNPATFWAAVSKEMHLPAEQIKQDVVKVEAQLTELGIKIAPVVSDIVTGATDVEEAFGKLSHSGKIEIGILVGTLAVGGPLLIGIAGVVRAVQTIGKAFRRVPVVAGESVAATDAELATLRASAAETSAVAGRVGPSIGGSLSSGVGAGTAAAETKLAGLRGSLLALTSKLFVVGLVLNIIPHSSLGQKQLDKLGVGFLGHIPVLGGAEQQLARAGYAANQGLAGLTGNSDAQIAARKRRDAQRRYDATHPGFPSFEVWKLTHPHGTRAEYEAEKRLDYDFKHPHSKQAHADAGTATKKDRPKHTPPPPAPFTTTIPVGLQINLQRAQNAGDVASERRYLEEEKAFLEREQKKAKTQEQRLEALQAIGAVDSQLQSLQTSAAAKSKKRTTSRKSAYQAKVTEEENRLKINLARAQLAERKAGQNKAALDRAYRAERRALTDEIDFYRREAHDQQLSIAERQKYAKDAIAAENAKTKIGQQQAQATKAAKSKQDQAEAAFLQRLQDVYLQDASNIQPGKHKPTHVTINQSFPSVPSDQHRQARMAVAAMRTAFDG